MQISVLVVRVPFWGHQCGDGKRGEGEGRRESSAGKGEKMHVWKEEWLKTGGGGQIFFCPGATCTYVHCIVRTVQWNLDTEVIFDMANLLNNSEFLQ